MARKAFSFEEFQARFSNEAACGDDKLRPASNVSSMLDLELLADKNQTQRHFRDVPISDIDSAHVQRSVIINVRADIVA